MSKYIVFLFALILVSCQSNPSKIIDNYKYIQNYTVKGEDWKLIWEDNFDAKEIDTTKWTKIPKNNADWGNYMTSDPEYYEISDGKLYLKGIVNTDTIADSRPYLTGGIYTKGKFAFQYGKVEIHAKLESAKGAWPAMWMLAEDKKYGNYPKNGEIDIMEHLNYDDIIYQTTHSYYTLELKQKTNPPYSNTVKFNKEIFNTFGLEWFPDKLVFTLNGEETFTYPRLKDVDPSQWPYDQPFYLLIDQQLEGAWVGKADSEDLPVQMIIDWVKVYQ